MNKDPQKIIIAPPSYLGFSCWRFELNKQTTHYSISKFARPKSAPDSAEYKIIERHVYEEGDRKLYSKIIDILSATTPLEKLQKYTEQLLKKEAKTLSKMLKIPIKELDKEGQPI